MPAPAFCTLSRFTDRQCKALTRLHAFTLTTNNELYTLCFHAVPTAQTVQNLKETVNLLNNRRFGRFRLFKNASPERLEANQAHRLHKDHSADANG